MVQRENIHPGAERAIVRLVRMQRIDDAILTLKVGLIYGRSVAIRALERLKLNGVVRSAAGVLSTDWTAQDEARLYRTFDYT